MRYLYLLLFLILSTSVSFAQLEPPSGGKNYLFSKNGCILEVYFDGKIVESLDLNVVQWVETRRANTTQLRVFDQTSSVDVRNINLSGYASTDDLIVDLEAWKNECSSTFYLDSIMTLLSTIPFDTTQRDTNDLTPITDSLGVVIEEVIDVYDLINSIPFDTTQRDTNDLTPLINANDEIIDSLGSLIQAVIYDTSVYVTNPYDDTELVDSVASGSQEIRDLYALIDGINFDTTHLDTNNLSPVITELQTIVDSVASGSQEIRDLYTLIDGINFDTTHIDTNNLSGIISELQTINQSIIDDTVVYIGDDSIKVWFTQPIQVDNAEVIDSLGSLIQAVINDTSVFVTNPYDDTELVDSVASGAQEIRDLYTLISGINFDTTHVDTNDLTPIADSLGVIIQTLQDTLLTSGCVYKNNHYQVLGPGGVLVLSANTVHSLTFYVRTGDVTLTMGTTSITYVQGESFTWTANECQKLDAFTFGTDSLDDDILITTLQ